MTSNDLRSAIDVISRNSHLADFAGRQPPARIQNAEATLGLDFPPTYKEFLAQFGCGGIGGLELYGVVKDDFVNSGVPDAIWLTLDMRRSAAMPEGYILVAETGDGGFYAIDTAQQDASQESPIVEWWPGFPRSKDNPRMVAPDFGAFFLKEITQALAREKFRSERADAPAPPDLSE